MATDQREVSERLDVLDQGRAAPDAAFEGSGRHEGRLRRSRIEEVHKGALLADEVAVGDRDHSRGDSVEVGALSDRAREGGERLGVAGLDADDRLVRVHGSGGQGDAVEHEMGREAQQRGILLARRLTLDSIGEHDLAPAPRRRVDSSDLAPPSENPSLPLPRRPLCSTRSISPGDLRVVPGVRPARAGRGGAPAASRRDRSRRPVVAAGRRHRSSALPRRLFVEGSAELLVHLVDRHHYVEVRRLFPRRNRCQQPIALQRREPAAIEQWVTGRSDETSLCSSPPRRRSPVGLGSESPSSPDGAVQYRPDVEWHRARLSLRALLHRTAHRRCTAAAARRRRRRAAGACLRRLDSRAAAEQREASRRGRPRSEPSGPAAARTPPPAARLRAR